MRNCQVPESLSRRALVSRSSNGKGQGPLVGACGHQGQGARRPGRQGCGRQDSGPGLGTTALKYFPRVRKEAEQSEKETEDPARVAGGAERYQSSESAVHKDL